MEEKLFAVGDVVRLKSGGPWMTVEKIDGDIMGCIWHNGQQMKGNTFRPCVLEKNNRLEKPKWEPKCPEGFFDASQDGDIFRTYVKEHDG